MPAGRRAARMGESERFGSGVEWMVVMERRAGRLENGR